MKKLLKWIPNPVGCWRYTMDKEKFLLFCAACIHRKIEDPTVWEVDYLTELANLFLDAIHTNPGMFDEMPFMKKGLFWTRLVSRFRTLRFERDDTRHFVDMCGMLKGLLADRMPNRGATSTEPDISETDSAGRIARRTRRGCGTRSSFPRRRGR